MCPSRAPTALDPRATFDLRELFARLWEPPNPQSRELGQAGEVLAARIRLWVVALAALSTLGSIFHEPSDAEPWIGMGAATAILLTGAVVLALARRSPPPRWLSLFSCLFDVTILSLGNAAFVLSGHPLAATNSRVFHSFYYPALALTCLRQDPRLCLAAGLAAMLEYGGIVLWAAGGRDLAGAAFAQSSYGTFNWDNQVGRLVFLAAATAICAAIVRQNRGYLRASVLDPLTGLPNRRYAEARLEQAIAMARRHRRALVLALADLDHFKQVNDRHGHAAGDEVLCRTADALRRSFRMSDVIARYGGEEFFILFPESEVLPALDRLERFRAAFAAMPAVLAEPVGAVALTLSVGVAVYPVDGDTPEDILERADQRLYAAKQAGRNRLQGP